MIGISIREDIGLGDKVQFSSLPENYFRATGNKLVDVSRCWIYDHNPYVVRDTAPDRVVELWNFPKIREWPQARAGMYKCNAEIHAKMFGVKMSLNRPRLYRFEDYPFESRELILFHTHGKSNGPMPDYMIKHVIDKYGHTGKLMHLGLPTDRDYGIPKAYTPTFWDMAELLSQARMLIGVDSGPAWIAACYPDVVIKKVRLREVHGQPPFDDWIPMERENHHSHWDDRAFQIYCDSPHDQGFMRSYRWL